MDSSSKKQKNKKRTERLTLANDMASHPIMLGIAAIIKDWDPNKKVKNPSHQNWDKYGS